MDKNKQANIILEELDKVMNVNWAFKKYYLNAIKKGLDKIERTMEQENKKRSTPK